MRHPIIIYSIFLLCSCYRQPLLLPEGGRRAGWDSHQEHELHRDLPSAGDSLYISGVEYPPGYDWVRDTAHNSVNASILLFKGSKEILRVPADDPWSADPDCHRIVGGHLYTFAHAGGYTIIGMDGAEILRYEGEESIRGFAVEEGRVLTLGQRTGNSGFAFRVNGKAVFYVDDGYIRGSLDCGLPRTGALYSDKGHWCFSYTRDGRIHLVQDNREVELPAVSDLKDAMLRNGRALLLCLEKSGSSYTVHAGSASGLMHYYPPIRFSDATCSFIADGSGVRILARGGGLTYVWDTNSPSLAEVSDRSLEIYPCRGGDAFVYSSGGRVEAVVPGKLPEGSYTMVSGACAMVAGNRFAVGLSGLDGSPNALVVDGDAELFNFNGPITSIWWNNT